MPEKPQIALYWCSSCGGCEESVVDLAEDLLSLAEKVDIRFWPVALDAKHEDLEAIDDGQLAAVLINGAVRMGEQETMARLLRKKARLVFAHGACAHLGGVVGLANLFVRQDLLDRAFREVPSVVNPDGVTPHTTEGPQGQRLELSPFQDSVKPLDHVVEVDYYIPGCPPTPALIRKALTLLLENRLPQKGSVLADRKALCHTCPRIDSRPAVVRISAFKRLYDVDWDPGRCFLAQDIICLGPATRGGCEARCIGGNMPCRGCFGPTESVTDQGAKSVSLLASMLEATDEKAAKEAVATIPDLAGLLYRYSVASSILQGRLSGRSQAAGETES